MTKWDNLPRDIKIEIYCFIFTDSIFIEQIHNLLTKYVINKESIQILKQTYKILKQKKPSLIEYQKNLIYTTYENITEKIVTYNDIHYENKQPVNLDRKKIQFPPLRLSYNFEEYKREALNKINPLSLDSNIKIRDWPNILIWNQPYILVELMIFYGKTDASMTFTQRLFYKKDALWTVMDLIERTHTFYREEITKEQAIILYNKQPNLWNEKINSSISINERQYNLIDWLIGKQILDIIDDFSLSKIIKTTIQKNDKQCVLFYSI